MAHLSYEDSKKRVVYGLVLLAIVTLVEVGVSLLGKGHIIAGAEDWTWLLILTGLIIIGLSLYKAYFIVYEFMHMKYEMRGLAMSVLLPTLLLVWAIIAFFQEGNAWKNRRQQIKDKNEERIDAEKQGLLLDEIYILDDFQG